MTENSIYDDANPDPSRTTQQQNTQLIMPECVSEVQRGLFQKPLFFSDGSMGSSFSSFSGAVDTAAAFNGVVSLLKSNTVKERNDGDIFRLTEAEYRELIKRAKSIASYGNVPQDVVEDFLIILCYIDNIDDMTTIANGVQISELADSTILRKPLVILAIRGLEKIAFAASAVEGLVNMFRRYLRMAQNVENKSSDGDDMSSILSTLGSLVGGFGGGGMSGATTRLKTMGSKEALGHFLSELILGQRIPMTVIAKNPELQSPSYTGKAFFGEAPSALSNMDMDQQFCKKIAVFPKPSNGAGTTAFGMQNMGGFSNSMSMTSLVSKIVTGSTSITAGSKKARKLAVITDKISSLTGATADEVLDIRRADTAIPMMQAISAAVSGTDKCIFSLDTFSKGWKIANSVSNHLQVVNPTFMESIKRFL